MSDMFCFQCQQTAGGSGCVRTGVCGKQPTTAHLQDILVCRLIRLAEVCEQNSEHPREVTQLLADGLFTTLTNVNFDDEAIRAFTARVEDALRSHGGDVREEDPSWLWRGETDLVSLRSTLLFGLKGMAAYAHHAMRLGCEDETVSAWFCKGLSALAQEHSVAEWLALITEFGEVNFKCMALLDRANTSAFSDPVPTRVHTDIQKGPFIVVSGHDLEDLHQLLEQTAGKGINVYTHSEMLPAHGYPGLNKYPHLAGNFGTAWQNQQKEFADLPAPILFTTNCIMPPRESYADRVYTTSVVGYKGLQHIEEDAQGRKDFSPIIEQALALGGYETDRSMSGINGGHMLTTGFAHAAVLAQAPQIIEAIKRVNGYPDANSTEFDENSTCPVIDMMEEQKKINNMGGTMRLGAYPCKIKEGTLAYEAYKDTNISERHRHRYEVNNEYRDILTSAGAIISGTSPDDFLVEMIELENHPWFLGCQFHPEFKSRPNKAHPLFKSFIKAAKNKKQNQK